jgi:hypothetical protein
MRHEIIHGQKDFTMAVIELKTVGRSGQVSLGKALAGKHFFMENLPNGDVLLKHAMIVPVDEQWLHTNAMKDRLAASDQWMAANPAWASDLSALASKASLAV